MRNKEKERKLEYLNENDLNFSQHKLKVNLISGVSIRRLVAAGCVLIGLFISSEPTVFGLDGSTSSTSDHSAAYRILWPMAFALGFLPVGIMNVLIEKEMKKDEVSMIKNITYYLLSNMTL